MATLKQRAALKEITENHRSVSEAMRIVGYSPSTATKPSQLTDSDGFQELMRQLGLTDEFLLKRHLELLNKTETKMIFSHELGQFITEETNKPDTLAVSKGLDMAYKLKGAYVDIPFFQDNRQIIITRGDAGNRNRFVSGTTDSVASEGS